MKKIFLKSPSKINLNLKILKFDQHWKKHKLSSRISILKLSDEIKVIKSKKLSIKYNFPNKNLKISNDIISKTIKFFDKKYKTKSNFNIQVIKNIPIGYGLGGGSSNAATILKFLYSYHGIDSNNFYLDSPLLGSDILLFIDLRPKIIDGIKNVKFLTSNNPRWKKIYLIIPKKKNLTREIFNHYKNNKPKINFKRSKNDLIYSSIKLNKEFKDLYEFICSFSKKEISLFDMTGTGSSIYLSFSSISAENLIISDILTKYPSVRIEKTYYFS